ncbi:MAG: AMP-binding protein [Dehalococcoidia bacterium]
MYEMDNRPWFKHWPKDVPRHIDYPEIPLYGLLSEAAIKYPDTIAFTNQSDSITYAELDQATNKLAAGLIDAGIKRGDTVVLFLPNCIEFVIGYYGILKTGATVTPVNPLYKEDELKYQINDCNASALITNNSAGKIVEKIRRDIKLKCIIISDQPQIEKTISLKTILDKYAYSF